ncbi:hypothetical protein JCM5353_002058 [Sporobolomyces roseus]
MPSHLPVELLRLILDNFACPPISNDDTLRNPHRHELLALCLTSKILRQIAQPLLFAVVSFEGSAEDDIEGRIGQLIDDGGTSGVLSHVRGLSLKGKARDDTIPLSTVLADLARNCSGLSQMELTYCSLDISELSGFKLRKLFLNNVDLEQQNTSFVLPSLHSLGLVDVYLPEEGFKPINFPSLRHLAYDESGGSLLEGVAQTLAVFTPQLDSIVLVYDIMSELLGQYPSFTMQSVLVDYLSDSLVEGYAATDSTKHARARIEESNPDGARGVAEGVNAVRQFLEDHTKCRKLESIYLPPLDSLETSSQPISVRQAVDRLIFACQNRDIEVVHEEQPSGMRAERMMSEGFMRRMTKERIERESTGEE